MTATRSIPTIRGVQGRLIATVIAAAFLCVPSSSLAAPLNDDLADAETIASIPSSTTSITRSNVGATAETGEPNHRDLPAAKSVWFEYTPPVDSFFLMSACSGGGSPRLDVYTGDTIATLDTVPNTFGFCSARVEAEAGTSYKIAVDTGHPQASPTFDEGSFNLEMSAHPMPANDDFAGAEVIDPDLPTTLAGDNRWSTTEAGEPNHAGAAARGTVWYRLTPTDSRPVSIDACDFASSTSLLRVAVYQGQVLNSLTPVTATPGGVCRVVFYPEAGESYSVVIGAVDSADQFNLDVRNANSPPNDNLEAATTISGTSAAVSGTNVDSTSQVDEPDHFTGLPSFYSVWFAWTAPITGTASIGTCDSNFDSVVAVYTGSGFPALSQQVSDDDGSGCVANPLGSSVTLPVTQGTRYLIAVDGYDEGNFVLSLAAQPPAAPLIASQPPPASAPKALKKCKKTKKSSAAAKKCRKKGKKKSKKK